MAQKNIYSSRMTAAELRKALADEQASADAKLAKDGKLSVESTANADTPFGLAGVKPLLVVDVWEHAYYLDWQNQRAAYAKAVVEKHLDWPAASCRFGNV